MNGSLCRLSTRFCSIKAGTLNKINSQITSFYMQVKINQAQQPFPAAFIHRVWKAWTWLGSQNTSREGDTSRGEEAATLLTGESDIPSCLRVEVENVLGIRHVLVPNGGSVLRSGLSVSFLSPFPPFIIFGMSQGLVHCSGWSQRVFFLSLLPSARVKGRLYYWLIHFPWVGTRQTLNSRAGKQAVSRPIFAMVAAP